MQLHQNKTWQSINSTIEREYKFHVCLCGMIETGSKHTKQNSSSIVAGNKAIDKVRSLASMQKLFK